MCHPARESDSTLRLGSPPARHLLPLAIGALLIGLLAAPTVATEVDHRADSDAARASAALARVESALAGTPHQRSPGSPSRRSSLTMDLRDLHASRDDLSGSDRVTADRILARPTDGEPEVGLEPKYKRAKRICNRALCVHYKRSGKHAATDRYAKAVRKAATRAHRKFRRWGFRPPLRDPGTKEFGGDARPDIYLGDLGTSLYGYAAAEGHWEQGGEDSQYGYVVLDRDFETQCKAWYARCTPKWQHKLMRVTVAHEYFHLVQFGYDYDEDRWFMEATATWIEDEVFDGVNDNVNYLWGRPSAMRTPRVPLDAPDGTAHYGNWIYFRHLSERHGRRVVRKAWNRADAWRGYGGHRSPPDHYSLQATRGAAEAVGVRWNREFARFAEANRRPWRHYDEAGDQRYPVAPRKPRRGAFTHSKAKRKIQLWPELAQLSSMTLRFEPGAQLRRGWKLRVRIDGNISPRGGHAIAVIKKRRGGLKRVHFHLGGDGSKTKTLRYGRSRVRWIEITVVNASTRYHCDQNVWMNTCRGVPLDDDQRYRVVTRVVR